MPILLTFMCPHAHARLRTHVRTYTSMASTRVHTCLHAFVPTRLHTCLHAPVPTCVPTCLRTHVPAGRMLVAVTGVLPHFA